ncbi:MAG: aminotransferase class I/II-fold pyridoxal phosphate-dependent enzyme, partial [Candidatus Coatesbacteria bacterium]|nr:aminotransferase class I/II-fold pyridoxal phosphate-dependent enzyme [Candidatus Coatesbacteria bacterium]
MSAPRTRAWATRRPSPATILSVYPSTAGWPASTPAPPSPWRPSRPCASVGPWAAENPSRRGAPVGARSNPRTFAGTFGGLSVSDKEIRFAKRLEGFGRQTGFEIKQKALKLEAQGIDVIHLEVGEPDFPTPRNIIAAAKAALDAGQTHYAPSAGLPVLRETMADFVSRKYDNQVEPNEVVIATGAKPLIFFSIQALVDPGETVLIPDINFPAYEAAAKIVGASIDTYPLVESTGFRPDLDAFADAVAKGVRLVILNSPHNPTGGMLTAEDYAVIAELSQKYGFWVLSDEIYSA